MNKLSKKLLSAVTAAAMLTSVNIVMPASAAATEPVISYTFDGDDTHEYTLENGASLVDSGVGQGYALSLDAGSSQYAELPAGLTDDLSGDFTIMVDVYPTTETWWTRVFDFAVGTSYTEGFKNIFFSNYAQTPKYAVEQYTNGSNASFCALQGDTTEDESFFNLNSWNTAAIVHSGTTDTLYINGVNVATVSGVEYGLEFVKGSTSNYLGKSQYSSDAYYSGMIDNFEIYDVALDEATIVETASKFDEYNKNATTAENDCLTVSINYSDANGEIYGYGTTAFNVDFELSNDITVADSYVITAVGYDANGSAIETVALGTVDMDAQSTAEYSASITPNASAVRYGIMIEDTKFGGNTEVSSIPYASVTFPSSSPVDTDETTYGAHDPSIFKDPESGKYYAYSTHNLIYESSDLINWVEHDYTGSITIPPLSYTFINSNYSSTTPNSTYWAPDIIYREGEDKPYWMYVSVSCGLGGRNSVIELIKSDNPLVWDGNWEEDGIVFATKEASGYKTNAIDSNIYVDTNGNEYFIWGSFWQGIQAAPLLENGFVDGIDYTSDSTILSTCQNFGSTIFAEYAGVAGPEGGWMINNTDAGYRYLFTSCGWLGSNYNIRIARSALTDDFGDGLGLNLTATEENSTITRTAISTLFTDDKGNSVGSGYSSCPKTDVWGYKLIGSYQLGDGITYIGPGHNSVLQDDDGEWYLVSHTRKVAEGTAYLQVRRMLWTDEGWPVVSPMVYAGEEIQTDFNEELFYGEWDLCSVGVTLMSDGTIGGSTTLTSTNFDQPILSSKITFNADGTLGDDLGTWSLDGNKVTIKFTKSGDPSNYEYYEAGDVMTMYALTGFDKDEQVPTLCLTGMDQDYVTQFATRTSATTTSLPSPTLTTETTATTIDKTAIVNPELGFDANGDVMYAGDPAALVDGDTVYIYAGHDTATDESYVMPEWVCYSSKDMTNWTYEGVVMSATDVSWRSDNYSAWASQAVKYNDKYYLYFCTWDKTSSGKQSIGVAVSDSPTGPFTDIGAPLVAGTFTTPESSSWNDIDPTVLITTVDGEEHRYLAWGNGKYYVCELNEDMVSIKDIDGDGEITMHVDVKQQTFKNMGDHVFTEAPWLYERDGKFYTFFAADWREQMAYATADSPWGPWYFGGIIMPPTATSNTNHPAVIDFNGKTYFIYHNGALTKGSGFRRSICIQELTFDEDGRVYPLTEMSTENIDDMSTIMIGGKYVGFASFTNSLSDSSYPLSVALSTYSEEQGLNTAWQIVAGKADTSNESYVSIQSVNKPGLYISATGETTIALTQDDDGEQADAMTFKTVEGLSGSGVSFESVAYPGRYITVLGTSVYLSGGYDVDNASFTIGDVSEIPETVMPDPPEEEEEPTLTPDVDNDLDDLSTGTIIYINTTDTAANTSVDGVTLYIGTRGSGADPTSNWAIASSGVTGNALVMNSGKFVSSSRGPRMQLNTPYIPDGATAIATMNVKLGTSSSVLRIGDSTSDETCHTEVTGLSSSEWSTMEFELESLGGSVYLMTVSVNGTEIYSGYSDAFPVLWGTTTNSTGNSVLFDNITIQTITADESYTIDSVDAETITVTATGTRATIYAAKYDDAGTLTNVQIFSTASGTNVYTASFEPDKVFVWSSKYVPWDMWSAE